MRRDVRRGGNGRVDSEGTGGGRPASPAGILRAQGLGGAGERGPVVRPGPPVRVARPRGRRDGLPRGGRKARARGEEDQGRPAPSSGAAGAPPPTGRTSPAAPP